MLVFDTCFEAVFTVDFREVVGDLERLADFVGGQEVIAAQVRQATKCEAGKTAVFGHLRDALNSKLSRNAEGIALWAKSRGVKMVKPSACYVDRALRERMGVS